jgi:hypothetical protein
MAHPYHHALASVKKWGGDVSDYLPLHTWFDLMWTGKSFFSRYSATTGPCAISPTAPLCVWGSSTAASYG